MKTAVKLSMITSLIIASTQSTAFMASTLQEPGQALENLPQATQQELKLTQEELSAAAPPSAAVFHVQKIQLTGDDALELAPLLPLVEGYQQRELTMNELNQLIDQITAQLRHSGYPAGAAYLPEQTATDGNITIALTAGTYGAIKIDNQSQVNDGQIARLTKKLASGKIIRGKELQTVLYTLNDLGGVSATGMLSAGTAPGTTDVTITVVDGQTASGIFYVENYGAKNSGRYRYNLQGTMNNLSGSGDRLMLSAMLSNQDLHNYSAAYERLIDDNGTVAGISQSRMDYTLGGLFGLLGAQGNADTTSLYFSTPLYTTAHSSMKVNYGYDYRQLKDEIRQFGYSSEKKAQLYHIGISGHYQNQDSRTSYSLTDSYGKLTPKSDYAIASEPYVKTQGEYNKVSLRLNHKQQLSQRSGLNFKFQGQLTSKNLDSSEQLCLGGALGVRAYPQGESSGDEGYQATVEYEYYPPNTQYLTFSTYLDTGHVKERNDGQGSGKTLSGWGIGVTYAKPADYFLRLDYARKLGNEDGVSADAAKNGRVWFMAGKQF